MTDNEQIIIDGIDVGECKFFYTSAIPVGNTDKKCGSRFGDKHCENNLDCYYKQLKRKEQECKILKEKLEQQKGYTVSYKSYVYEQLDQLKAENEKLKEYLKIGKITTLEDGDLVFESKFIDEFAKENAKLKQALDEIEEVCKDGAYDEFKMPLDENSIILDIINKAKEQK